MKVLFILILIASEPQWPPTLFCHTWKGSMVLSRRLAEELVMHMAVGPPGPPGPPDLGTTIMTTSLPSVTLGPISL